MASLHMAIVRCHHYNSTRHDPACDYTDVVRRIIEWGADIEAKDEVPFHWIKLSTTGFRAHLILVYIDKEWNVSATSGCQAKSNRSGKISNG